MAFMCFVLFSPVLPLQFSLLNLCTRDRNDAVCQPFESLEWRFLFGRLGVLHASDSSTQCFERNAYTTDVPTVMMIKSVRISRDQSIREKTPDSVNRNASQKWEGG